MQNFVKSLKKAALDSPHLVHNPSMFDCFMSLTAVFDLLRLPLKISSCTYIPFIETLLLRKPTLGLYEWIRAIVSRTCRTARRSGICC